jgi:FtsZ-interacting cell division protein ZipA
MDDTVLWIIIAAIVLLLVLGAVALMSRKRKESHRTEAQQIREEAKSRSTTIDQREAKAAENEARARAAEAEAEMKAAEARRMRVTAEEQKAATQNDRTDVDEQWRRADELDPDYDHKSQRDSGSDTGSTGSDSSIDPGSRRS